MSDILLFYSKVSDIIDSNVPLKLLSMKETRFCSKPWITPGLKASIYGITKIGYIRIFLGKEVIIVIVNLKHIGIN